MTVLYIVVSLVITGMQNYADIGAKDAAPWPARSMPSAWIGWGG